MTEVWKTIPGFGGKYELSNLGQVKRLEIKWDGRVIPEGIMPIKPGDPGHSRTIRRYPHVVLRRPGSGKTGGRPVKICRSIDSLTKEVFGQ